MAFFLVVDARVTRVPWRKRFRCVGELTEAPARSRIVARSARTGNDLIASLRGINPKVAIGVATSHRKSRTELFASVSGTFVYDKSAGGARGAPSAPDLVTR